MSLLWSIVGIIVPTLVGAGLTLPGYADFDAAWWSFVSAAIILGAMTLYWIIRSRQQMKWRIVGAFAVAAIILVGLPGALRWVGNKEQAANAQTTESAPIVDQSVKSFNQSGGITAHTLKVGPQPRHLSDPPGAGLKAEMLSFPKDKPIEVSCPVGDAESCDLAQEVFQFLKDNGFDAGKEVVGSMFPAQVPRGLIREQKEDRLKLYIGPPK